MFEKITDFISDLNQDLGLDISVDDIAEIYGEDIVASMEEDRETVLSNIEYLVNCGFGDTVTDICNRFGPILLYDHCEFCEKVDGVIEKAGKDYLEVVANDLTYFESIM